MFENKFGKVNGTHFSLLLNFVHALNLIGANLAHE